MMKIRMSWIKFTRDETFVRGANKYEKGKDKKINVNKDIISSKQKFERTKNIKKDTRY